MMITLALPYKDEYDDIIGKKFSLDVLSFLSFKNSFHLTILNFTISLRWGENEKMWKKLYNIKNKKVKKK